MNINFTAIILSLYIHANLYLIRLTTHLNMWDFNIGKDVRIYGKMYHIYNCDVFTRNYLMTHGITVPPEVSLLSFL